MKVLLIDTSSKGLYIGLNSDGEYYEIFSADCGVTHSQILLPKIDELLRGHGLTVSDVDVFSVTTGPGSFTGLRIAACTVKGFLLCSKAKVVCCNTLECVAYNYLGQNVKLLALIDAKHNNAFCAVYDCKEKLEELEIGFFNRAKIETLKADCDMCVSAFDNTFECGVVDNFRKGFYALTMERIARGEFSDENFEVVYLKRSQAEEEYDGIC